MVSERRWRRRIAGVRRRWRRSRWMDRLRRSPLSRDHDLRRYHRDQPKQHRGAPPGFASGALSDRPPPAFVRREPFDRHEVVPRSNEAIYGTGRFCRRIRLVNHGSITSGELEDDFHHFRIDLRHDGSTILDATATPLRGPWTSCMETDVPLRQIEGHPLSTSSTAIGQYTAARDNCTHLFDLTGLAIAHALRDQTVRLYDFEATDASGTDGRQTLRCWRDGQLVLDWLVGERRILAPSAWSIVPLFVKFIPWAEEHLDPEVAEAAIALRRVISISGGRTMDLDDRERASELFSMQRNTCHTFSPSVAPVALRRKTSARDFMDHPELLLSDMPSRDAEHHR